MGVYLDRPAIVDSIRRSVPGAAFTLVRLIASEATILDRVASRELGSGRVAQAARSRRQLTTMRLDERPEVRTLDIDGLHVTNVASTILALIGWAESP